MALYNTVTTIKQNYMTTIIMVRMFKGNILLGDMVYIRLSSYLIYFRVFYMKVLGGVHTAVSFSLIDS